MRIFNSQLLLIERDVEVERYKKPVWELISLQKKPKNCRELINACKEKLKQTALLNLLFQSEQTVGSSKTSRLNFLSRKNHSNLQGSFKHVKNREVPVYSPGKPLLLRNQNIILLHRKLVVLNRI